jgi:outer membrane lipase/esterase
MQQQTSHLRWIVLLLSILLPSLAFAHKAYDRVVVFGDSLSDPGNAYYLLGTALTPPYATLNALLIPDAPYAIGGHHFSDGPTWIEQFSRSLDLKSSAGPALVNDSKSHRQRNNYAIGGARARNSGSGIDFTDQVNIYLSRGDGSNNAASLYVVEFGGNDVRDAIAALAIDPTGGVSASIITDALTALSDNILSLYASGARVFLIANSPDLSLTPAIRTLDLLSPGSGMAAAIISAQFNADFDALLAQLQAQLPAVSIAKLDIYHELHNIVANPDQYRLSNVTDPCVTPNIPPYSCRMAKRTLFWDGIHPTKRGHAIFAELARDTLFPERESEEIERYERHCRSKQAEASSCRH